MPAGKIWDIFIEKLNCDGCKREIKTYIKSKDWSNVYSSILNYSHIDGCQNKFDWRDYLEEINRFSKKEIEDFIEYKYPEDFELLFSKCSLGDYQESIFLFFKDCTGKYYEVSDSHCSLEGFDNLEPHEVSFKQMKIRKPFYDYDVVSNLWELFLEEEEKNNASR